MTDTRSAFLSHYEPLHEGFIRYCHSKAYGFLDTEDLAQEAILTALQNWSRIRDKNKLLSYLMGTVNNILRNQARKQKYRGEWAAQRAHKLESELRDPSTALDIQYLLKAMDELPREQAETLRLFELSGFSIKEISQQMGISEGAIKTRLSRARARLRELLQEEGKQLTIGQRLRIYASLF